MNKRYEELDSLRGLAALSVFFGHMFLVFNPNNISQMLFEFGPLRFMIAGSEAVILFFVLSGFVLSLPFYSKRNFSFAQYTIKRICRIYVPYISAILLAFVFREVFYSGKISGLSDAFNTNWSETPNINSLIEHIFLINTFNSNLNNVVWSLVHEMRISLVFPFIMFLLIRLNLKKAIYFGIGLSVISVIYSVIFEPRFWGTELYATVHYSAIFVIGALLAKYHQHLIKLLSKLNNQKKLLLFITGIILFLYAHPSFIINILIPGFNPFYRTVIDSWITSFGASILIIFAISFTLFSRILKNKIINYIGKISFSLYLCHYPVLFASIHLFHNTLSMWFIYFITVTVTFIISALMFHLIEKPSMKLGSYLTKQKVIIKENSTVKM